LANLLDQTNRKEEAAKLREQSGTNGPATRASE